jgi:hypothetical protein
MTRTRFLRSAVFLFLVAAIVPMAFAQQTGSIAGRVTTGSEMLPGVTVEARSNVLPQPRVTTTSDNGEYRLPLLPPGRYTVTFNLSGMNTQTRTVDVLLNQESTVNATLGMDAVSESITVSAEGSQIDTTSTEIKSGVSNEVIEKLPVGQEYRDLVKLSPGVMYTETLVRGPSAGGSGQDNTYLFDGVNVSLPQYGTLSAEPSSHDIAQISVTKGGAQATDFNRSAGFLIDSVSKSGTNEWSGELGYQLQTDSMSADVKNVVNTRYDEDRTWGHLNVGGPIVPEQLFFYGSYYRPTSERENRSNRYGEVPPYDSSRDEFFGKLTYTPLQNVLLNGSYRHSDRETFGENLASQLTAGTASGGNEASLDIGFLEASWIIDNKSYLSFRGTDFANKTSGRPDTIFDVQPTQTIGTHLDLNNLDQLGQFDVPCPIDLPAGAPCDPALAPSNAFNSFITPIIERYGYDLDGKRLGGGVVGAGRDIEQNDFFRKSYQLAYDRTLGSGITHDFHVGYQWNEDAEDLQRVRNGWGGITVPGGRTSFNGTPIYYQARYIRSQLGEFPIKNIHSEVRSENVELNDVIRMSNWTFNVGVLVSHDKLYGQGLKEDSSTISGYVASPGTMYEMYDIPWEKLIQPRVGAMWAYNGRDTVYANYAKYNPTATSLPRAASWDRNTVALFYEALFDQSGNLFATRPVGSSSGKLFQKDMDPRYIDEFLLGTSREFTPAWSGRAYTRYRYSSNFWEDTPNAARVNLAPEGYPKELYIPDLAEQRAQIGSGSGYVIAELDNAFTKYLELTTESEWRGRRTFLRGSYTWSHYYGTFDQDNTSSANDANIFIGSSNLADAPGHQIWDHRYGNLHGDRTHMFKAYGSYTLPWNASAGAFAVFQSGEPWEAWDYRPYQGLPGWDTGTTSKYAEPAGSRRSPSHYQVDLNYTQNIPVRAYTFVLGVDLFNLFDKQTGFNPQPVVTSSEFGVYRNAYAPRRFQVTAKVQF